MIITDTGVSPVTLEEDDVLVAADEKISGCNGCWGCWVKTPGLCVKDDGYGDLPARLSMCDELLIVSKCVYGSVSPAVKRLLERCIGYVLPDFEMHDGKMRHKERYKKDLKVSAWFYGNDLTEGEKKTAEALIEANAVNLHGRVMNVIFLKSAAEVGGGL